MEKSITHGKPVYIFESHNIALAAWAEIKRTHDQDLILITLDYHTDKNKAFRRSDFVYEYARGNPEKTELRINERISQVDWRDDESIHQAVTDLKNDEQIDAAIRLGLFSFAFCINHRHETTSIEVRDWIKETGGFPLGRKRPEPPYAYEVPDNKIFEVGGNCSIKNEETTHGDDCATPVEDQVIESVMLEHLITTANSMARFASIEDITRVPYVLDIDLDYFRTLKSLSPDDATTFHAIIRNAVGITIATEPAYVHDLRMDDELTSDYALERVLQHINSALSA